MELVQGDLVLARALLIDGRPAEALDLATAARNGGPAASLETAEAGIVEGEALQTLGRRDEAFAAYQRAAGALSALEGADRFIAQAWCELAELFDGLGELEASHAALRAAARASGLKVRRRAGDPAPVTTSSH